MFEQDRGWLVHRPAVQQKGALPQHASPAALLQLCPGGTQATPPQTPFVQGKPLLQQTCVPSHATPSRRHAPPSPTCGR